ncbi:Hypothetical protein NAEGRDRAFT_66032 [Naegleria gruberi]|uniref:F-box domain-containing protein n=1 Tax=Naegleria gruberi TaxID=5762 RepID=D2VAZ4_NAEGR|nr:uncharacterized protein NAEGRDRAFT_66032 [Naegleria gruberi]EFC46168.1 Hypothetical protein NAEGRDRAFT_66032 [Naegleria gruberi]|eukprot:XP_002678912.1 Hypothetical protein NAEGRDRAFT_66032 [Naegleria gruberi strain NEG-M]
MLSKLSSLIFRGVSATNSEDHPNNSRIMMNTTTTATNSSSNNNSPPSSVNNDFISGSGDQSPSHISSHNGNSPMMEHFYQQQQQNGSNNNTSYYNNNNNGGDLSPTILSPSISSSSIHSTANASNTPLSPRFNSNQLNNLSQFQVLENVQYEENIEQVVLVNDKPILSMIPQDLLKDIFSFLDFSERFRFIRVASQKWNSFIIESEMSLQLNFTKSMLRFATPGDVLEFVRKFPILSSISVYGDAHTDLRRRCLREIQSTSSFLRSLSLYDSSESELSSIRDISFPNLRRLHLETPVVTSNLLSILNDLFPNITNLSIKYTTQEKTDSICKMYNNFGKLKELKLIVTQQSNQIYDGLNLTQLETIEVHHFLGFVGQKKFSNILDVNVSGSVNDLPTIVHLFPNVTSLDISNLYQANSDAFESRLVENLPKLQHVKKLTLTDSTTNLVFLDTWTHSWSSICELDISRISISDAQLSKLSKLSNLSTLKMKGLSVVGRNNSVIGDTLLNLRKTLTYLDISDCKSLVNILPNDENANLVFPKLKVFKADGANLLSDKSIRFIIANAPNLESIGLMGCNEVQDETISSLASSKLIYLDLRYCRQLSNNAFFKLVHLRKLTNLQDFKLALCFDVTHIAIESILRQTKYLRILELNSCNKCDPDYLISKQLFEPSSLPCLTEIDFSGTKLSDNGLLSMLTSPERKGTPLSNIINLKVSDCYNLTHDFLDVIDKFLTSSAKPYLVIPIMVGEKKLVFFRCPYLRIDNLKQSLPRPQNKNK